MAEAQVGRVASAASLGPRRLALDANPVHFDSSSHELPVVLALA
jgi:hypothetical protein